MDSSSEINDRRETEGAYAAAKRDLRRQRLYTELQVTDNKIINGEMPHATVMDSKKHVNIPPFRCNCKLMDDRKAEYERIKEHLDDCRKEGVCKYLMRLNDRWENVLRLDTGDFYETREVMILSEAGPGEKKQTMEKKECITMTSMLFCKHGGLITPVFNGQISKSSAVPELPRVTRVSDKLIELLKDYETGKKKNSYGKWVSLDWGEPALEPYPDSKGIITWGWGHALINSGDEKVTLGGKEVNLNMVKHITREDAERILAHDISKREKILNDKLEDFGIEYKVTQRFYDALFDLIYNIGDNHLDDDDLSTFLDGNNFDLSDSTEIMYQFGEYSKLVCGLMCRRVDELDIIFAGNYTRERNIIRYGDIWGKNQIPTEK